MALQLYRRANAQHEKDHFFTGSFEKEEGAWARNGQLRGKVWLFQEEQSATGKEKPNGSVGRLVKIPAERMR